MPRSTAVNWPWVQYSGLCSSLPSFLRVSAQQLEGSRVEAKPELLETWEEARLLWWAKDWNIGGVAQHLRELAALPEDKGGNPKLKEYKLSKASIQRKSVTPEPIPPPIAAVIEALETRPKGKYLTRVVETGLREIGRAHV